MYDYESIIMDCHTCAEIGCGRRECSHKDADGCEAQLLIDAACAIDELCRVQLGADWISVKKSPPKEYSTPLREKCGLPPVSDTVLITLIDPDVVDGKKDPYKGDRVVIADRFSNGELVQHKMLASQKTRPIAWKPLPKPFVDGGVIEMVMYDPYTNRFYGDGDSSMSPRLGDQPKEAHDA